MANGKQQKNPGKQAQQLLPPAKPEIVINGKQYDLRMSLWASEQIEAEFGDLQEALKTFQNSGTVAVIRKMFVILANAGRKHAKLPMDIQDDVLDDCSLGDLSEISRALRAAMDRSMHAETVGGNEADDEPADALAAEYDEKNAGTGEG